MSEAEAKLQRIRDLLDSMESEIASCKRILKGEKD